MHSDDSAGLISVALPPPRRPWVHPPWQVSTTSQVRLEDEHTRGGGRELRCGFLLRVRGAAEARPQPFRYATSSNPISNLLSSWRLAHAPPIPAIPVPVARISRDVHPSVRRKLVHHACCPSRTAGFNLCSCRCAPPPDPLGWLCGGLRRSPVLVRRRTARVSLNASRRARARRVPAVRELSPRARLFACTSGLLCRRLWVCVLVVSC